jgi:hypothetical protein
METFRHIEIGSMFFEAGDVLKNLSMPVVRDEDLMREILAEQNRPQQRQNTANTRPGSANNNPPVQLSNPLLNEPPPAAPPLATQLAVPDPAKNEELEPPSYNPLLD